MLNNDQAKEERRSCDNLMKCPQMAGLINFLTEFECEADALTKCAASSGSAAPRQESRCCRRFNNSVSCCCPPSPACAAKTSTLPMGLLQ